MSDANIILHAIQSALNAAIATAVAEATKPLLARIEALENNPAIGVDTTLEARVKVLENAPNALSAAAFVTYLDQQEWFWEKLNNFAQSRVEEAIDDHLSSYDHDQYDEMYNEWGGESVSEFIKDDDLESQINDALRNASFEVRVTL
jgi:hypothetical protein